MNERKLLRKPLKKMLLVNWSKFGAVSMKINGSTLFTGVNGSGKSTILDAMTYLITGNTQFNTAAQDRERTVLRYVRGDTKSHGEYRYLRSGEVVSYIVMEFYSPADRTNFVVGVCIESQDEGSQKSYWFVRPNAEIGDFNFYSQDGDILFVTPHLSLCCRGEKLKAADFLKKEMGIKQVMRQLGLRYDPTEYRRKLMRMMAFKQENNIDHFIRDCVLPEHPIDTIPQFQEQKAKYEELQSVYENLLKQKAQLETIEKAAAQFEAAERNVYLKWMLYHHQNVQIAERSLIETGASHQKMQEKLERSIAAQQQADAKFEQANRARMDAQRRCDENDIGGSITALKVMMDSLEQDIALAEKEVKRIQELQKALTMLCSDDTLSIRPADETALAQLCSPDMDTERKYEMLYDLSAQVKARQEECKHSVWECQAKHKELDAAHGEITAAIRQLENSQHSYPKSVEHARHLLQEGFAKIGIHTEVRTFAELVESIQLPEWRKAIETYLGSKRFHLMVEPRYVRQAMQIFHDNGIRDAHLVMTDKLPDREADPGSAAEILSIPNPSGRKYANYLLGRIHLCNTLEELHDHPLGGLMANGALAKSYAMSMMNLQNVHYYLGADAIRLELDVKRNECEQVRADMHSLEQNIHEYRNCLQKLETIRFDGYDLDKISDLPKLQCELAQAMAKCREMEQDPTFLMLMEELDAAKAAYIAAASEKEDAIRQVQKCQSELERLGNAIEYAQKELAEKKQAYESFAFHHLELKREAAAEYERQAAKREDGIVIAKDTIRKAENQRDHSVNQMENAQLEYCRLAGLDLEKRGRAYIGFFRELLASTSNVQAEEAKMQLADAQSNLESAFMNDCIAELIEGIQDAEQEIRLINSELRNLPFGNHIYTFKAEHRADKAAFFRIMKRITSQYFGDAQSYLAANADDPELEQDIREFMERILSDCNDAEYTDYRNYLRYDMEITNRTNQEDVVDLSEKQGSASNGEKQTPYFIILAASLMQCYPRNTCCARLAFMDEAFSALSSERIEQMVKYFEQNGFQVMYAAPPEKINTIGSYIDSTISLIEVGRYTYAVEGLADEIMETKPKQESESDTLFVAGLF